MPTIYTKLCDSVILVAASPRWVFVVKNLGRCDSTSDWREGWLRKNRGSPQANSLKLPDLLEFRLSALE